MEKQTMLTLQFSNEEMLYMISILRYGTLPGMADRPLEEYPEEERIAVLRGGFNSLQARKLISYDAHTKTASLDTFLLALFSTCGNPQATMYVGRIPVDAAPTTVYYHQREKLFVSHQLTGSQIHTMTVYFDADTAHAAIASEIFTAPQPPTNSLSIEITEDSFNTILRLLADSKHQEALEMLKKVGLGVEESSKLIDCLHTMSANSMIATVRFDENSRQVDQGQMIAWIESPQGDFRIETRDLGGDNQRIVYLTPFNRQVIQDAITDWFQFLI